MSSLRDLPHPFPREAAGQRLEMPFFEKGTDEYKSDLANRGGGVNSTGGTEHRKFIDNFSEKIKADAVSEDEIDLVIHRNPRAATEIRAARKLRDAGRRVQGITSRNIFGGVATPFQQEGPVQPGAQQLPVIPAQPASFNLQQATQMAAQEGILTPEAQQSFKGTSEAFAQPSGVAAKSPFAKINPKDFTRESVAAFSQTGDFSSLVPLPKTPLVEITGPKGETKATEAFGTGVGERANKRVTFAQSAAKQSKQLDRVALALSRGAKTGKFAETILEFKSAAKTLGIPIKGVADEELVRTVSNEMALRLRNPESGLGLTGNTSNRDLEFLKASVVGLGRTKAGNAKIINLLKKFNKMQIAMTREQSKIIRKAGKVPLDLDEQLFEFMENYDFFSQKEMREIQGVLDEENAPAKQRTIEEIDAEIEALKRQAGG